ncbi:MAG: hypothetical protein ACRYFR_08755 [Janthinobacterium lividum]
MTKPAPPLRYELRRRQRAVVLRREFDFDIFILSFKIRPGR